MTRCSSDAVPDTELERGAGAPADEIMVTPEMIRAGGEAVNQFRTTKINAGGLYRDEAFAVAIYRAMALTLRNAEKVHE
jgi:hypothetical protein